MIQKCALAAKECGFHAMMPLNDPLKKQPGSVSETRSPDTEPSSAIPLAPTPAAPFQLRQALGWPASDFTSVSWSPDGKRVAAGSADRYVRIWNVITGAVEHLLEGHQDSVQSVAWSPDGRQLASGSEDRTVRLWEASSGRGLRTLEGHQASVQSVVWSPDGQHLASGSYDGDWRIWSCQSWQEIKRGRSRGPKHYLIAVDFVVAQPTVTTFGDEDIVVQSWTVDASSTLDDIEPAATRIVHSTSAKIVFVGESNVGKSCLALRLAEERYEEQGSTLGMKLWTLRPEQLDPHAITPPGETRDVTLWDLGGQDEYRLVHQLFLHDTTLALVLFDPTRGRTAFEEVEGWNLRLEKQLHGRETVKLLVGTKLDQSTTPVDQNGLQQLLTGCGFAGYYATSAKTGDGIPELREALAAALDWDKLAKTTRPLVFQQVRDAIAARRDNGEIVLPYNDLAEQIRQGHAEPFDPSDVDTVVKQLAVQGVVVDTRESSGPKRSNGMLAP
jgi:small GTP-binding protein